MKKISSSFLAFALLIVAGQATAQSYLGFDRNTYPGDDSLRTLRQTFTFAGYWLNNPPGAKSNNWAGKRPAMESAGFGFLVLFNGRLYKELKSVANAEKLGRADAQAAVVAARREGFPPQTIIFLDQEQGGRMLPAQKTYIYAWVDSVTAAGFRAGVYCSGIAAREDDGSAIVTADDIREHAEGRKIAYFITNDACPPAPGCTFPRRPPQPDESGIGFSEIWQFAQSPRRPDFAAGCPANYAKNGQCYAPATRIFVDVDTATSSDPSFGRSR